MINVNSFQSLGAVDGPGIRFVVFLQGCNIRCKYCHNPETLSTNENSLYTAKEIADKIKRYENYIKDKGGVTFSGGEPLLQAKELIPLFKILKDEGYHIALDTNGSVFNDNVKELLKYVDLVLLDIKMPNDELYFEYTNCHIKPVLKLLKHLNEENIKVWIRQVVIEGVNDTEDNIKFLNGLLKYDNIEKTELLPFKKLCLTKYESMNLSFLMKDYKETDVKTTEKMKSELLR